MTATQAAGRSLWRHPDFLKLWSGQAISSFGSHVTMLALPLTAVLVLGASPLEMGLLGAVRPLAGLVVSLPAGAWADRVRRRSLLAVCDLLAAGLLFSLPAAAWLGHLSLTQLFVVAFLTAGLSILTGAAYLPYVASLVARNELIDANSKLRLSASTAQIVGPSLGGLLVELLTAPVAILADAASFLISSFTLVLIRQSEPAPAREQGVGLRSEMVGGIVAIARNPLLRSLAGASATFELFDAALFAVYVLYMTRTLHLSATAIGLTFGLAGLGGIVGSLAVSPLSRRLGAARTIVSGIALATAGEILIAGATGPVVVAVLILVLAEGAVELGATLYGVNVSSLQLSATPDHLRGRVAAAFGMVTSAAAPLGALLGGVLGQTIGLRETVLTAGIGTLFSILWLARPPLGSRTGSLQAMGKGPAGVDAEAHLPSRVE